VPVEVKKKAYETMAQHGADGRIHVEVEKVPLEDVASAWSRQGSSPGVKLVVTP
jgi:NADPH2:quinone reductase